MRPPQYLAEVEQLVGVRFFVDPLQEHAAHTAPAALGGETIATYGGIYFSGLRLLAAARRQFGVAPAELSRDQRNEIRAGHAPAITGIRDRLMVAAPLISQAPEGSVSQAGLRTEIALGNALFDDFTNRVEPLLVTFKLSRKSRRGKLHVFADDANAIRELAAQLEPAADDDVLIKELIPELQTNPVRLGQALQETGITIHEKLMPSQARLARYVSATEAQALREHYAGLIDNTGLVSVARIVELTNTSIDVVHRQIDWHGFAKQSRRQRDEDGRISMGDYLPDAIADAIIQELSVVVPDEYLTILEYATLRGLDDSNVRRAVHKNSLPTHVFTQREKSITYLDGATMHQLDQLMSPYERATEGWHTMKELEAEFEANDVTIASHLKDDFAAGHVRTLKPREGSGGAIPHYSPAFRAHLRTVIKPKGPQAGRTSLTILVERTGMTRTGLAAALRRGGVDMMQARVNGNAENLYLDTDLERVMPTLPKRSVPGGCVDVDTAARLNNTTPDAFKQRLKVRQIQAAGRYFTSNKGTANYYLKTDLAAAGFMVPAVPAFPAGERPYGRYGPARAPAQQASLLSGERWRPTGMGSAFIPRETHMSEAEIAEHTGAQIAQVRVVIGEMDLGAFTGRQQTRTGVRYSGPVLLRIIDRITGIDVDSMVQRTGLSQPVADRVLRTQRVGPINGVYSPGMIDYLISRRPPRAFRRLSSVAAVIEWDEDRALAFLHRHFGRFDTFLDEEGKEAPYLSPASQQLLLRQKYPGGPDHPLVREAPRANQSWWDRRAIVAESGHPVNLFEAWLHENLERGGVMQWMQTSDGATVPHFRSDFIGRYFAYLRRVRH